jgi:polysaccharide export outer membrane protein
VVIEGSASPEDREEVGMRAARFSEGIAGARRSAGAHGRATVVALVAALAALAGCGTSGSFVWIDAVPKGMYAPEARYAIVSGDVIGVRVWNQEANSVERTRVREDGKISLPFLNDVEVAGSEPSELARRLEVKLKTFIVNPVVTVVVHERKPMRVSVLGQVTRPGAYELETGAGVLHALAAAGGLGPFAAQDRLFVLRSGTGADGDSRPARIRFRYRDLVEGKAPASVFHLRTGDVVVVE